MTSKKYVTAKHSFQSTTTELEKLEKTHKCELRMISTGAFKFQSKFLKVEDTGRWQGETDVNRTGSDIDKASNVKMYETHFPGFCYQKDGKYRRRVMNRTNSRKPDSIKSSENVKALLFTRDELDIEKVLCLHVLGTQVHHRRYIQRKDGRSCTFIKSQVYGNRCFSLQTVSQRLYSNDREISSTYDKVLPRYVLDVSDTDRNSPTSSVRTCETDSCNEEDATRWRKFQVPIYVNNDVRVIVSSVIEALETVNSPKLKELINLARNPEKIRNLLSQEYMQEYVTELAGDPMINNATAYDFSITYPVLDKISDSTTETVAQVLEISSDSGIRHMLYLIRKNILRRYEELVQCNVIPGKKKRKDGYKGNMMYNSSRTSFLSPVPSVKMFHSAFLAGSQDSEHRCSKFKLNSNEKLKSENSQLEVINDTKNEKSSNSFRLKNKSSKKIGLKSLLNILPQRSSWQSKNSFPGSNDVNNEENAVTGSSPEAMTSNQQLERYPEIETSKFDLKSLSNSQRILLGLKVAGMKSRPVNMHQFENKKKVDIGSIIMSIVHPLLSESNYSDLDRDILNGQEQKRTKRTVSKIGSSHVEVLENLTRGTLSNFRHDIAASENKKRVKKFMDAQLE